MNRVFARVALVTWLGIGALLVVVRPASAYVDPGTGSLVIQTLVAGAMVAGLVVKTNWRRLRRVLTRHGRHRGDDR